MKTVFAVLFVLFVAVVVSLAETPSPAVTIVAPASFNEATTPPPPATSPSILEMSFPYVMTGIFALIAFAMFALARSVPQAAIADIVYELGQAIGQVAIDRTSATPTPVDDNAVLWVLTQAGYTVVQNDEGKFTVTRKKEGEWQS